MRFHQIMMVAAQAGGSFSYDTDAAAWFAAVVTAGGTVSDTRKGHINTFILAEKAAGTWDLTDDYWQLAAESATQALVSLKQLRTATVVNSPTFVADQGYTGNGTNSYVNTGFIPNTHGVALTTASVGIGVYERTNVGSSSVAIGVSSGATIALRPRNGSNFIVATTGINGATFAESITDSRGLTEASRSAADTVTGHKNGVALADVTGLAGTAALSNGALFICANNNGGTPSALRTAQVAFAFVGGATTSDQRVARYNNVQALMTAIGAQV